MFPSSSRPRTLPKPLVVYCHLWGVVVKMVFPPATTGDEATNVSPEQSAGWGPPIPWGICSCGSPVLLATADVWSEACPTGSSTPSPPVGPGAIMLGWTPGPSVREPDSVQKYLILAGLCQKSPFPREVQTLSEEHFGLHRVSSDFF